MEFKCINIQDGCFYKNKKGETKICHLSPCQLNLSKFGKHRRIIAYYLNIEDWESAFSYFDDLTSESDFECDIEKLYEIKNKLKTPEVADLPLGCRIFKIEASLRGDLSLLLNLQKLNQKEPLSSKGKRTYNNIKTRFKRRLNDNLEILKHIVKDDKHKTKKESAHQEKGLEFLEKTIELAKRFGDSVNVPDVVEQAFNKTMNMAGFKTKEHRDANIIRTKIAKEQMSKDKLVKELKKQLLEKNELTPELEEKLKELMLK